MEKKRNDNEEMEIDLLELLMVMKKHLSAILLAGIDWSGNHVCLYQFPCNTFVQCIFHDVRYAGQQQQHEFFHIE